jgi:hypothetical protein
MPFFLEPDGTAIEIHWGTPELEERCAKPHPYSIYYTSLAGICRDLGVQATAFERPIRAEDYFCVKEVMRNNWKTDGLKPVERRATYKITFFDGVIHYGGRSREELVK